MKVIFDVDGTLMDIEHRRVHLQNGNNDWEAFNNAMEHDTPNFPIMQIAREMSDVGHEIVVCSARNERHREITESQIRDCGVDFMHCFLREDDDFRPDEVFKQDVLDALIENNWKPDLVFDDRNKVVDMWRRNGLTCVQVAEGDF